MVKAGDCDYCNEKAKDKRKVKSGRAIKKWKYVRKKTGEMEVFKEIWDERPHVSEVSGEPIQFSVWCFSHVLGKQAYPSFRLRKDNIVLETKDEHIKWETQKHLLKDDPKWKFKFDKEQQLKQEYYGKKDS